MSKDDRHTKRKGDISEHKAITKLLEIGVDIYTPVGENTRPDLVYELNDEIVRVQIKTARLDNRCITFNCSKVHSNATEHKRTSYDGDVEEFIVYYEGLDQLYIVDINELPRTEMRLRIERSDSPNASYTNSNWAEDYELETEDDLLVGIE